MTVQDIVNAVSTDTRQVLQSSGADANVMLGWVDRIHKDVLHTSLYINQNLAFTSFSTAVGINAYTLTPPTAIRRIVSVYDATFNMSLTPADADIDQPSPTQANADELQGRAFSTAIAPLAHQVYKFGGTPEYFRFLAPATLILRPAPSTAAYVSDIRVIYEQLVQDLTALTSTLIVPNDGKDIIVSGVNWLAMSYIGRPQEAMSWFQLYQQGKIGHRMGIIR